MPIYTSFGRLFVGLKVEVDGVGKGRGREGRQGSETGGAMVDPGSIESFNFDAIPAMSVDLPSFDLLYCARQLTQNDADAFCQYEAKLRRLSRKHEMELDTKFKSGAHLYKLFKAHENKILPGFSTTITAQATLRRLSKGPVQLILHQPTAFRLFAAVRFGNALLGITEQRDNHLTCQLLEGSVPVQGDLTQEIYVTDVHEMAQPFQTYWQQFWNRDSEEEERSDHPWQEVIHDLRTRIPPSTCLTVSWDDPHIVMQTIARLKPFKAVGIDGWRPEELQSLPHDAIVDLTQTFKLIWPAGLSAHQLIARVVLLAKRNPATSITDGRPITILGYLSRLTSKLIADQLLGQWATTWPSAISGGLPFRGVQDVTFLPD